MRPAETYRAARRNNGVPNLAARKIAGKFYAPAEPRYITLAEVKANARDHSANAIIERAMKQARAFRRRGQLFAWTLGGTPARKHHSRPDPMSDYEFGQLVARVPHPKFMSRYRYELAVAAA